MYASSGKFGTAVANEIYLELSPKIRRNDRPLISFVHGAGANGFDCLYPGTARQASLTQLLASEWEGVSGDNGGAQTWGNNASISALGMNLTQARLSPFVHDTKYALIGNSMGGQLSIVYAAQAAVKPKAIVMVIPVINTQDIKSNNRSGYGSLIDAAYGGNYNEATHGAAHNPFTMRDSAALKNIPMLIFYGSKDALCLPQYTEAFIAADPTYRQGVALPFGHEYDAYAAVDHGLIKQFLQTNLGY